MLNEVFHFKMMMKDKNRNDELSHIDKTTELESEDYNELLETQAYLGDLESFIRYIRNLFEHCREKTKEKRTLCKSSDRIWFDPNLKPREQYMISLEETEVAASCHVATIVCKVLYSLAKADSFKGM